MTLRRNAKLAPWEQAQRLQLFPKFDFANPEDDELEHPALAHIPYRDSKLTRVLARNLGGNSHTGLLITLHRQENSLQM